MEKESRTPPDFETLRNRLVERLKSSGFIESANVEFAMRNVPRELFVPEHLKALAYEDEPLPIGLGQTISAPHMVAIMCEALELEEGQRVLEVGCGSGYHAGVVARIVGEEGRVFSVERLAELAESAKNALERAGIRNIEVVEGDGSLGLQKEAPFERIHVTCAAPEIPLPLFEQLAEGGAMLVPVGDLICELVKVRKVDGMRKEEGLGGCAFVPLRGRYGFS